MSHTDGTPAGGASWRVGVDVGGTFTDVVTITDGQLSVTKTPSTPSAPDQGVIDGIRQQQRRGAFDASTVTFFSHGTTVATNAVLEREWAETALVTTAGFRDVLGIGRQARPDIYDFDVTKPEPIVPRNRRYEVTERVDERGHVDIPLETDDVDQVVEDLRKEEVDSVAISLLFSFENPNHEKQVRDRLESAGIDCSISLSSTVLPEIREYERTLATALNAALKPVMDTYVGRLDERITDEGIEAPLQIMQSNGGIIDADFARERPINTLLSGPAAGVKGAAHIASLAGTENVLTMDMGGTSCDVSLVTNGEPAVATDLEVGAYPVGVPMVDVHTIGAGGGSIAWIDAGGALRVGPQSAGAVPGPICYGRGGDQPTVTDAQMILGRLSPDAFLSDDLEADLETVEARIAETLADPLGLTVTETAQGILDVANASMERALRVVSVERGYDPRDFGLVAFGGAGPLHASALADTLEIPTTLIPPTAGVLSALGLLLSDLIHDCSTSMVRPLEEVDPPQIERTFEAFEREGRDRLSRNGLATERIELERSLDLRYAGQSFELSIPIPDGQITPETLTTAAERFHERHATRYGHAAPGEPVELVTVRLRARGLIETPSLEAVALEGDPDDAIRETRPVVYDGEPEETRIYDRTRVPGDTTIDGPAILEGAESTVVVRPNQHATLDSRGTISLEGNQ